MRTLVLLTALATFLGSGLTATAQDEKKAAEKKEEAKPKVKLSDAEKAAVAAIKKLGGSVLEVAQDDGRLDVPSLIACVRRSLASARAASSARWLLYKPPKNVSLTDPPRLPRRSSRRVLHWSRRRRH